jgi:hypothetical protein
MGAQKKMVGKGEGGMWLGGKTYLSFFFFFFFFFSRRSTTNNQPTQSSSANDKRENSAEIAKLGKWVCTDSGDAAAPVNLMKKFDVFFCQRCTRSSPFCHLSLSLSLSLFSLPLIHPLG